MLILRGFIDQKRYHHGGTESTEEKSKVELHAVFFSRSHCRTDSFTTWQPSLTVSGA